MLLAEEFVLLALDPDGSPARGHHDQGQLGREKAPLRPTRHPVGDPAAHAALLAEVRSAAIGDGPMGPRLATLLALARPSQLLEVVAPKRSDRARAKERIRRAPEEVPAAAAVTYVIQSLQAAVATTAAISAVASSG